MLAKPTGIRCARHKSAPCTQPCSEYHKCSGQPVNLWASDDAASMMLSDIQHSLGVTGLATDLADICSKPVESLYRLPSDGLYIYSSKCPDLAVIWWHGDALQLPIPCLQKLQLCPVSLQQNQKLKPPGPKQASPAFVLTSPCLHDLGLGANCPKCSSCAAGLA
jgi:hypothetical protein